MNRIIFGLCYLIAISQFAGAETEQPYIFSYRVSGNQIKIKKCFEPDQFGINRYSEDQLKIICDNSKDDTSLVSMNLDDVTKSIKKSSTMDDASINYGFEEISHSRGIQLLKSNDQNKELIYSILESASVSNVESCGLSGKLKQRIKDCKNAGARSEGSFVLVMKTEDEKEVYLDKKTGFLWSHRLEKKFSSAQAKKACSKDIGEFPGLEDNNWRLPTHEEYSKAEKHKMSKVVSDMSYWFWAKNTHDDDVFWAYNGYTGRKDFYFQNPSFYYVRCVSDESKFLNILNNIITF